MAEERSFGEWMSLLRTQDEEAARHVFQSYARRLIGLAKTKLDPLVRRRVDPEDVVQSVFRSFFQRYEEGRWDLRDWNGVWAMLTCITVRKCGRQNEFGRAACRDVHREVEAPAGGEDSAIQSREPAAPEPSPESAALLTELVEQMFAAFKEHERPIVARILQGETPAAISQQVGCSESKVYRLQRYIHQYLVRLRDES
jgi:RNA polymerase sigma-70 factor (ECF subfamily)